MVWFRLTDKSGDLCFHLYELWKVASFIKVDRVHQLLRPDIALAYTVVFFSAQ